MMELCCFFLTFFAFFLIFDRPLKIVNEEKSDGFTLWTVKYYSTILSSIFKNEKKVRKNENFVYDESMT